jgi:RND family efflux transporter MFP subunit
MTIEQKLIKQLFATLILVAVILLFSSCGNADGTEKDKKSNQKEKSSVFVKTEVLKSQPFTDYLELLGVAKAFYQSTLSSDEGGKIKEFIKDKGSYVKEGDVILVIDNDVLKANMDAAEAQYEKAENNFKRQEELYNQKVTSELQYLNQKYERDAALANYKLIKARYEKTFIKAPFSGVVDKKFVEVGETVLPTSPIVSVVSMYTIKVESGVPENYVNQVKVGDDVKVVFKDLDGIAYNEKVSFVGNSISTDNRTFPIEIHIKNSDGKIKPELSAKVYIQRNKYNDAIVIPEETVTQTDVGPVVFVAEGDLAKMRNIEIIARYENKVAVKSGLKEGDKLIEVGFQNLVDGTRITETN